MLVSAPSFEVDVITFGRKWPENLMLWRQFYDVKTDVATSKGRPDVMNESQHFLAPVGFTEIPVGYARKCGQGYGLTILV